MNLPTSSRRGLLGAGALAIGIVARPSIASAQPSPEADAPNPAGGSLIELLTRVAPDPGTPGGPIPALFTYADIQRQLNVRGLRPLDAGPSDEGRLDEWANGVDGLWTDDIMTRFPTTAAIWDRVGFTPADVTQTLSLGELPSIARVYRGIFDAGAIERALTSSGYDREATSSGTVWSIGAMGEYDLADPVGELILAAYNNIAVVDDELVIASPFLSIVEAILGVAGGTVPGSLTGGSATRALIEAAGVELVSAGLLDGVRLSTSGYPERSVDARVPTVEPDQRLAPISLALFGVTAGSMSDRSAGAADETRGDLDESSPRSDLVVTAMMSSATEARRAVPIIERRLAEGSSLVTGEPYADLFERWQVQSVDDGPLVRLVLSGDRVGRRWLDLVFQLDLGFLSTD